MKTVKPICILFILFLVGQGAFAKVSLPSVFSDNMVLQQKTNAAIWGTAAAGKGVQVTTSWNKKQYTTIADSKGNWKVKVLTVGYGGPYTITISDAEPYILNNVLLGEVWLCSGQSNMEMPLAGWGKIDNYEQEIANANYPNIRLLQVVRTTSNVPRYNAPVANGGWTPCTPQYVAGFSAVAYFFAREVYTKTNIPVGLIHTSWGGTIAEAWTSGATLKTMSDFADAVKKIESDTATTTAAMFQQKLQAWQQQVHTSDAGYSNGLPAWATTGAAYNTWPTINVPGLWESTVLPNMDGIVWLKRTVVVPADRAGKPATLNLGMIDDNDITWVNGQKVGETEGYNQPRSYTVPVGVLKAGENEITIRVYDGSGGGGLYDEAKNIALVFTKGESLPLAGAWRYKVGVDLKNVPNRPTDMSGPNRASVLYNAMIHPFIQYNIRGALWYQGESNAGRANQYRSLFPALITDWRKQFGQGDFPFYFVQLANFMKPADKPEESAWAELREAQTKTLSLPNTGMAVAIDIGNADDIHPKNKQEVGRRLALIALAKVYNQSVPYSGPMYSSHAIAGSAIRLNFAHTNGGLVANGGNRVKGFEVAGADKKFYPAEATISGNQVVVSSTIVSQPIAVRYNWANNPGGNLTNKANLPASPFRTDEWPGVTINSR